MTAALQFRNLTLGYDRHPAVHHLDGAVESGALVAVVGPNGAGKSTLFKGIVGVLKPLAGRIERGDANPQNIAYLPQAAEIDRTFPINVYDMVAMGLWRRAGSFGGIDRASRSLIEQAMAAVGLSGFEERAIATLSRGSCCRTRASSCWTSRSTRSMPRPRPTCSIWCGAGTASGAPCSPPSTIW